MITVYAHIRRDEEVAVALQEGEAGKYAVLEAGKLSVFINSREKALEIASLLESAAQKWEVGHEYGENQHARNCEVIKGGEV